MRLSLRREALAELTPGELSAVNAGTGPSVDESCPTLPVAICTQAELTQRPCITDPLVCTV